MLYQRGVVMPTILGRNGKVMGGSGGTVLGIPDGSTADDCECCQQCDDPTPNVPENSLWIFLNGFDGNSVACFTNGIRWYRLDDVRDVDGIHELVYDGPANGIYWNYDTVAPGGNDTIENAEIDYVNINESEGEAACIAETANLGTVQVRVQINEPDHTIYDVTVDSSEVNIARALFRYEKIIDSSSYTYGDEIPLNGTADFAPASPTVVIYNCEPTWLTGAPA